MPGELVEILLDDQTPTTTVNMIVNQLQLWRGNEYELPIQTSSSLSSVVIAHNLIGWQAFMEGCLSVEWNTHASTFLPSKQNFWRWTTSLVKKLLLIAFDMWDNRCNKLYKNDLSNKVHGMGNIDRFIMPLAQINTIQLLSHQHQLFILLQTKYFTRHQNSAERFC